MEDERENLKNQLCMMLIEHGVDIDDIKSEVYMVLSDYEISKRKTEIAVMHKARNEELVKKFIVAKTVAGLSKRSIAYYAATLKSALRMINKTIDDITADDIRMYLAIKIKRDGVSKVTAAGHWRCLSTFYAYLQREGIISDNPMIRVDPIKTEKVKKEAFTEMMVEKIRDACRDERETALIELLLSTAARISEIAIMKVVDLNEDSVIVHGKGGKDRIVYFNAKAKLALDKYLNARNDTNPYIFPEGYSFGEIDRHGIPISEYHNFWKNPKFVKNDNTADIQDRASSLGAIIREIGKRAGVEDCHAHRFRRTCATFALRRGMPVEQVSKMLGHEQLTTTQIYLDLDEEGLQLAHKKYVV